jgi:hypothetical protein
MSAPAPESRGSVPPALEFSRLWRAGQVGGFEEYLTGHQPGRLSVDDLLDLIQHEVLLRETRGEVQDAEEYRRRFPDHSDQVAALFAVNRLLATPTNAADDDPAAPVVPGYVIGKRLGRGGTGEVFRSRDSVLGRPIAVNVLRPEWRDDPSSGGQFWGEARVTARLQHPGVPPLNEAGYDDQYRP